MTLGATPYREPMRLQHAGKHGMRTLFKRALAGVGAGIMAGMETGIGTGVVTGIMAWVGTGIESGIGAGIGIGIVNGIDLRTSCRTHTLVQPSPTGLAILASI